MSVSFNQYIGVCGIIGSGKTTIANLIRRNYNIPIINCDNLFKEKVLNDLDFFYEAKKYLNRIGINILKNGDYNTEDISKHFFSDDQIKQNCPNLYYYNCLCWPYLLNAFKEVISGYNTRVFVVEMATLPNTELGAICCEIIKVNRELSFGNISSRDTRSKKMYENISKYQSDKLNRTQYPITSNINVSNEYGDDNDISVISEQVKNIIDPIIERLK